MQRSGRLKCIQKTHILQEVCQNKAQMSQEPTHRHGVSVQYVEVSAVLVLDNLAQGALQLCVEVTIGVNIRHTALLQQLDALCVGGGR
jgi:hypothetical protein